MTDHERVEAIRQAWETPPRTWAAVARRLETAEDDVLFLCAVVQKAGIAVTVLKQQLDDAQRDARRYKRALRDEPDPASLPDGG